jgi:hypothetical protein
MVVSKPFHVGCGQSGKVSKTVNSRVALLRMRAGFVGSFAFDRRIAHLLVHAVATSRKCFRPEQGLVVLEDLACLAAKACEFSVCGAATSVR